MENVYYNIYGSNHMMGAPILGDIENIYAVTRDMVVDFHNTNYFGKNMVLVGTGSVEHQMLVDLAEKHLSKFPMNNVKPIKNTEKPIFTPSLLFVQDEEMQ